ncbi:hypothetical protein Q8A73_012650 [Channa argus]|nr:hypothetical protein Q8A73_012650 [Channa argus]
MSVISSNSSDSTLAPLLYSCFNFKVTIFIFMAFVITNILLFFPIFFLIFYLGLQQWRKHRSISTSISSHSDFFTYNVISLELISILGFSLYCFGAFAGGKTLELVGVSLCSITSPGQTLFHLLTCVERYLAVVHPITYQSLKRVEGLKIRNVSTGCIWLLCAGFIGFSILFSSSFGSVTNSCLLVFALIVVSFCSFSVLHALNHPGEVSGHRRRVDPSKQRAFYTIAAIMVALLLRFVGVLLSNCMYTSPVLTHTKCVVGTSAIWFTAPCSLVLPLLFLQRAGKLPRCKHKNFNKK